MTRMWLGIKPKELCREHLLGEHKELHQEIGTLLNHPHGQAIVKGHVREGQVVLDLIEERHMTLVEEMKNRGYNHNSPLDIPNEIRENKLYGKNKSDIKYNREDLKNRCENCNV